MRRRKSRYGRLASPATVSILNTLRLPLPWDEFELPNPWETRQTVLTTGVPGWRWDGAMPDLGIAECEPAAGTTHEGWGLDHVVLLVPSIDELTRAMAAVGHQPRLRMEASGRPTAFFRVGPLLECIESPVRAPALFGVALVTEESLETVVLRWRSMGRDVGDPKPAVQPGRRIFVVRATEAGLAVMSPDRAVSRT